MFVTIKDKSKTNRLKNLYKTEFEMDFRGAMKIILIIEIHCDISAKKLYLP